MSEPSGHPSHSAEDAVAVYRADDLTIETGRQRVLRGEHEISLPKLSFDLLLTLIRAAPNVVTLDALTQEVWPNVVVSPETLSQRIKLLRDALGDDSRNPRYIASLRGRGYRFIPSVVRLSSPSEGHPEHGPAVAEQEATSASPRKHLRAFVAAMLMLATVGALLLIADNRWRDAAGSIAPTPSTLPAQTVAVLPFQNLSTGAGDELIAFGVAEGLLHRLASIRDLTLIARTSSFAAAQPRADARAIGQKLNARYLIEGSVQRSGSRLRVTAQLIDAATGAHVWSLRFDRTIEDIFAVEDEITQNVAEALRVSLTENQHPYARFGTDAYLALLQGRALTATHRIADGEQAIERFERAIEIAPDFAIAYVDLANAKVKLASLRSLHFSAPPILSAIRDAHPLVAKALQLDDAIGEGYVLRGFIKAFEGDVKGAEADYRKGLDLAPNYGPGYEQYSEFLHMDLQRFDDALAAIDRARLVDPLRPRNHYVKGRMLAGAGSFKDAEELYLRALEIAPDFYPALLRLGEIRWLQGQFAEAVKLGERALAIEPPAQWVRSTLADFYLDLGDIDAARAVLADQTEEILWVSICVFQGEVERAAGIIAANSAAAAFNPEDELIPFAIRDAALASGRPEKARDALIERRSAARSAAPRAQMWGTTMALAQIQRVLGNSSEAEELARSLLQIDDPRTAYSLAYARPVAHALLGDDDAAIRSLEQNVERGQLRRWWYTFEREPALTPSLRADPRFQSLAGRVREHANSQRRLLRQMHERGEAPLRKAGAEPARGSC
jgi:TolB-like protein/DNA-binding winged helix-turn-helix (wHTH) protein/Tfp pilus assembly protein PilF